MNRRNLWTSLAALAVLAAAPVAGRAGEPSGPTGCATCSGGAGGPRARRVAASDAKPAGGQATAAKAPAGAQVVEMTVTRDGFEPSTVKVKAGVPVQLVVTRKVERPSATEIVIKDLGVNQKLPLDRPVTVSFTPTSPGKLRYACGMDMIAGTLVVE